MRLLCGVLVMVLGLVCVPACDVHASDTWATDPTAVEAAITIEGSSVRYVGKINNQNVDRLLGMVDGIEVTELLISSGGGEINAGMRMGEWAGPRG